MNDERDLQDKLAQTKYLTEDNSEVSVQRSK